jgi:hypothetical protein
VGLDPDPGVDQACNDLERGRLADVICLWLEGEPQDGNGRIRPPRYLTPQPLEDQLPLTGIDVACRMQDGGLTTVLGSGRRKGT